MPFLPPNQQRQSTEGILYEKSKRNPNRLFGMAAMHAGFTQLQ